MGHPQRHCSCRSPALQHSPIRWVLRTLLKRHTHFMCACALKTYTHMHECATINTGIHLFAGSSPWAPSAAPQAPAPYQPKPAAAAATAAAAPTNTCGARVRCAGMEVAMEIYSKGLAVVAHPCLCQLPGNCR
eukprot:1157892-Pelagomonas_calceolata.AAC.5